MAVEARHLNLFPSQLLSNREMMNQIEGNGNLYNTQMGYGLSGTTTVETLLPIYNNHHNHNHNHNHNNNTSGITDSIPHQKPSIIKLPENQTNFSYNNNNNIHLPLPQISMSRKRSRENNHQTSPPLLPFLGHDISLHMQQQQLDIDRLISQHMERVRMEMEEKRKRHAKRVIDAIEETVMKKLREKEEEIEKIGKMNWVLEDKLKSLCIENQIWRDLAHTNEATANALRNNLEHILAAQVINNNEKNRLENQMLVVDDAQSCCGSNWEEDQNQNRRIEAVAQPRYEEEVEQEEEEEGDGGNRRRRKVVLACRNCRKEESCVLVLPCRHLCLCTGCGSSVHTCPICKSTKTASVHVNMSS